MHSGRTVFAQLMDYVSKHEFRKCVRRYNGNYRVRRFSCSDQFLCMAFGQLTYRESLRDTITCLRAMQPKLYHVGIRGRISRATLADANEKRDWRIYEDLAAVLITMARKLYSDERFGVELSQPAYVFDSTTIDLCLSLFPWAPFRKKKAAIKLHTLMDLKGSIPCSVWVSDGKTSDRVMLDALITEPGSFYILDRGYVDFARLYTVAKSSAFFIVRAMKNLDYGRRESRTVEKTSGLRSDQTIILKGPKSSRLYPNPLRRVSFFDSERHVRYVFLTNNFDLDALTITQLYKCRWQVELFFKWIKQNLRIKAFYGTSENAVKTQTWIAISIYVLVAIIKKHLNIKHSLSEILQILSLSLIENDPLPQLLSEFNLKAVDNESRNQLNLFN
jgi:hypothetical protein